MAANGFGSTQGCRVPKKQSKTCFKSTRVRQSQSGKMAPRKPVDENKKKKIGTSFSSKVIMSLLLF